MRELKTLEGRGGEMQVFWGVVKKNIDYFVQGLNKASRFEIA